MDDLRKNQVSLRGASAKEITRNVLLERVSRERELRNFARRANSSALFIQRVWRRYNVSKRVSRELELEWSLLLDNASGVLMNSWISCCMLRPFLFFVTHLSTRWHTIDPQMINCMSRCFIMLLENINSTDPDQNFCFLAVGTLEQQRIWSYQVRKLVSLCTLILGDCSFQSKDDVSVTSLLMRVVIILTDWKAWKYINDEHRQDADRVVKDVIKFMGTDSSNLYRSVGRYMSKLNRTVPSPQAFQKDDMFLITASAITLALRPFQTFNVDVKESLSFSMQCAAEQYWLYVLTVPWLVQCIPDLLLHALRHKSILIPCFKILLVMADLK